MKNLIKHLLRTPQTQPLRGENQVRNHAGGYVYGLDLWSRLERFLILGSQGGTYYVSERQLTLDNAQVVLDALRQDAERTVSLIASVSASGRAPSNRTAVFALALAFCEPQAVPAARGVFVDVVRTGTHLFEFLTAVKGMRGFGRALRGAIADWYVQKPVDQLGYQLVKYRQRSGWTHRDALRMSHPKDAERNALFAWAAGRGADDSEGLPRIVRGFAAAQLATSRECAQLVREYGLTHEMVPSGVLKDQEVLRALAESMPLGALVRFLGRLSAAHLLSPGTRLEREVVDRLQDRNAIRKARIHPMALLVAQRTYASGRGRRGSLTWSVNQRIVSALDVAFHKAFANVEPSGKRILLSVDVSGSMGMNSCAGASGLTCAEGATALALVTAGTEKNVDLKAFSHSYRDLPVSPGDTVHDALSRAYGMTFGATDCALPMLWARKTNKAVDAFVILTDNETWYGNVHPKQALQMYRQSSGIDARLVVVAMTASQFSIADPSDPLSLDVVGFDTSTPALISNFVAGRL